MALMVDKLPVSAVEETDILRTKFQAVKSNADQQVERLEKLIIAFEEFEAPTKALEIWVENTERAFAEGQLDLVTPQVAKLEDGLEKIKVKLAWWLNRRFVLLIKVSEILKLLF